MAKDKKIDYSKLTLGSKKRTVKKKLETPEQIDEVVRKIHQPTKATPPPPVTPPPPPAKKERVRTKRVTLDIPIPLHAEIRKKTFDMGITMKKYFLDLAQQHLNEHKDK